MDSPSYNPPVICIGSLFSPPSLDATLRACRPRRHEASPWPVATARDRDPAEPTLWSLPPPPSLHSVHPPPPLVPSLPRPPSAADCRFPDGAPLVPVLHQPLAETTEKPHTLTPSSHSHTQTPSDVSETGLGSTRNALRSSSALSPLRLRLRGPSCYRVPSFCLTAPPQHNIGVYLPFALPADAQTCPRSPLPHPKHPPNRDTPRGCLGREHACHRQAQTGKGLAIMMYGLRNTRFDIDILTLTL